MPAPFQLPSDVINFIDRAFARCNARIASRLSRLPTVHETHLDFCFIEAIAEVSAPHLTTSGFVLDLDVHFLGSGQHWRSWEIADIGLIVTYRRSNQLLRTKIALLQSKRLYPRESEFVEDDQLSKFGGFGQLRGPVALPAQASRLFRFDQTCRYRALQVGDDQWSAIGHYENAYKIPVHYLLYHPRTLPTEQVIPVPAQTPVTAPRPTVGCRVLRSGDIRDSCTARPRNYAPSFGDLRSVLKGSSSNDRRAFGWRLESFVSDQVLNCREGYIAMRDDDEGLVRVFNARGAPISAAIRIDINAPEETLLDESEID